VSRDIDDSSEDVLSEWRGDAEADEPEADDDAPFDSEQHAEVAAWGTAVTERDDVEEPRSLAVPKTGEVAPEVDEPAPESVDGPPEVDEPAPESVDEPLGEPDGTPMTIELSHEHAAGELEIPDGYAVLEGDADGGRRAVGIVVSRFNGAVTSRLLERSLTELETAGVRREAITIMIVPGAFELALAATALAKTRRFACIVALGCVIRGDTPHFDYVASEAASGLQLAALETGVPVSFGLLTLDRVEQAEARFEKGAEAVRSALEMADVFSHLRAAAAR
jgi:6,7-dimethyl-8-ribityllumazine synthase